LKTKKEKQYETTESEDEEKKMMFMFLVFGFGFGFGLFTCCLLDLLLLCCSLCFVSVGVYSSSLPSKDYLLSVPHRRLFLWISHFAYF
jgi:formate/nitrite transporter FocA (FNT family)